MKMLLKWSLIVSAILFSGTLLAEESYSKILRHEQRGYGEEPVRHSSEDFSELLEKLPTAAGPQQEEKQQQAAPQAPRRYEPANQRPGRESGDAIER